MLFRSKAEKHTASKTVGSVVENSIVELKEELKKEKQLIRSKKYDDF